MVFQWPVATLCYLFTNTLILLTDHMEDRDFHDFGLWKKLKTCYVSVFDHTMSFVWLIGRIYSMLVIAKSIFLFSEKHSSCLQSVCYMDSVFVLLDASGSDRQV